MSDHSVTVAPPERATASRYAWIVLVACGVVGAMHVWKLPGALMYIRQDLGMNLVQSGALLGIVQVGAMILGLAGSILSERIGLRTTMIVGLTLLAVGSLAGAFSQHTWQLMTTRAFEGVGFLLVTLVAPPLIRATARQDRVSQAMGWWSAFQGMAVFVAVLVSTLLLSGAEWIDWHQWWVIMGILSVIMIPVTLRTVPADSAQAVNLKNATRKIGHTLKTLMPWVLAIVFACYTLQWGAIIGFLPDIFGQEGATGSGALMVGVATAVVGGINGVGNVLGGQLLKRGVAPRTLVMTGMIIMIVTTVVIFAPDWTQVTGGIWYQLTAAMIFSGIAALIPSSLTRIAVDVAPPEGSAAAVMGLMVQVYNAANFVGPVLLTSIAASTGGWHFSWIMTVSAAIIGLVLAAAFLTPRRLKMSFT